MGLEGHAAASPRDRGGQTVTPTRQEKGLSPVSPPVWTMEGPQNEINRSGLHQHGAPRFFGSTDPSPPSSYRTDLPSASNTSPPPPPSSLSNPTTPPPTPLRPPS